MKADELMTGDYIFRPSCYDKVVEIRTNGIIGTDSLRGLIGFNQLDPIPLTPEILEKIGFYFGYTSSMEDSINNIASDFPFEMPEKTWCYDDGDIEITIDVPTESDGGAIHIYANKYMEYIFDKEIYFHELQHALRLCGIDKNIEL